MSAEYKPPPTAAQLLASRIPNPVNVCGQQHHKCFERQGRSLIITSNRAPSDWYPLFPNPVVAESLLDRLINTSHQVIMNGPSCRPNKRPRNPIDKTK
ncbi:ATP-binding protein [Streptomyces sp. NPDC048219]|uniref:ATP-binding protein n=1 Tax=Streptomyces sp. NPDC048219 TaxID=3365517 RepID=UPI003724AD4C